ncbi:hypothetical protein BH23ACT9_BH23ACT9_12700 [soil metagenome]
MPDPDGIAADVHLTFPAFPPSFEADRNRVRWLLIVDVTLADGFTEDSVIPLWVVPAVLAPTPEPTRG